MKRALVSPSETRFGNEEQTETGYRIAEITDTEFPVADPMFWIDCPDDTNPTLKYYDPADQQIKNIWVEPDPEPIE